MRAVAVATGLDMGGWEQPLADHLASFGRGFLAGDLVFWPSEKGPVILDQEDGEQPDGLNPGPLSRLIRRGNMVYGNGCLVVADRSELIVYVPPGYRLEEREQEAGEKPASAVARYRLAVAQADAGQDADALRNFREAERRAGRADKWQGRPIRELAHARRHALLLDTARRARLEKHWDRAEEALTQAAAAEFDRAAPAACAPAAGNTLDGSRTAAAAPWPSGKAFSVTPCCGRAGSSTCTAIPRTPPSSRPPPSMN